MVEHIDTIFRLKKWLIYGSLIATIEEGVISPPQFINKIMLG